MHESVDYKIVVALHVLNIHFQGKGVDITSLEEGKRKGVVHHLSANASPARYLFLL
jgi:hypothetical protein